MPAPLTHLTTSKQAFPALMAARLYPLTCLWFDLLLEGKRAWFPFARTKRLGNVELAYANLDGRYFYRLEDSGQPLSNLFLTFSESIAHWSLKSR